MSQIAKPLISLFAIGLALALTACASRLDGDLCPIDRSDIRKTILLLDTSDPLSPKHSEELRRLVRELRQPGLSDDFFVAPGDALIVYELSTDLANLKPKVKVCNPGDHPNTWNWKQNLTEGRQIKLRQWRRFGQLVEGLFEDVREGEPLASSPIIETLGILVARHTPSTRVDSDVRPHFILFSDLLQHSGALSHYRAYPDAKDVSNTPGLRHLVTDLSRARISLFRLERTGTAATRQSPAHYYWWTHLVQSFQGDLIRQESI